MSDSFSIWKSSCRMLARGVAVALVTAGLILPQAAYACTSFILPSTDGGFVYGRTMEFGFKIDSKMIMIPRNFEMTSQLSADTAGKKWKAKYAAIGMNAFGLPALVDGMNEKGLAGGILYFPDFAQYPDPASVKPENSLTPWDFLSWALGNFSTVAEVKAALETVTVVGVKQADMGFTPGVHYTLHDATGASIVIEPIEGKLKVYDNPLSVLTNAPSFDWHMTNLRNYVNLRPANVEPLKINDATIQALGEGSGMLGIPGDATPPSRFVRVSANILSARKVPSGIESVRLAEHILNGFDIPVGVVQNAANEQQEAVDYTQWSTVADMKNDVYYVKTYEEQILRGVAFKDLDLDAKELLTIGIPTAVTTLPVLNQK
ncbi:MULTISPECIES: choloylglycine hydrolase family protein [unclassified Ochrobactrum]|uniref:linear amide C-N hydrolase n=1 Tax=unclassified Ochrobactrum TaxID=239106 RepID=UPI000DEEE947|nr:MULTISPECIES: choloylglycine hydrolase family protein [unclassified Ochrobactrum]MBQ0710268.1 choloylglycine hydrolase family protein [Ochrobactrum sp. AP1BH01-1]